MASDMTMVGEDGADHLVDRPLDGNRGEDGGQDLATHGDEPKQQSGPVPGRKREQEADGGDQAAASLAGRQPDSGCGLARAEASTVSTRAAVTFQVMDVACRFAAFRMRCRSG